MPFASVSVSGVARAVSHHQTDGDTGQGQLASALENSQPIIIVTAAD
jgi:hypothetical protein